MTAAVTNADIDHRLSQVEKSVAVLDERTAGMERLFEARFKTLDANQATILAKLDQALASNDTARAAAANSPAGRALMVEIASLQDWRKQAEPVLEDGRFARRLVTWLAGGSAIALLVSAYALGRAAGWW